MSTLLFRYGPYVALVAFSVGLGMRFPGAWLRWVEAWRRPWKPGPLCIAVGAGIVAASHLLGFLFREAMRSFFASPPRLFAFEAVSLLGGMLLAWGLLQASAQGLRRGEATRGQQGASLLLLVLVVQGVVLALSQRWGALWSLDLTVPYLRSLLLFRPEAALLEQAPLIVRLHVLGGFVWLAVAPFVQLRGAVETKAQPASPPPPLLTSHRQETAPKAEP